MPTRRAHGRQSRAAGPRGAGECPPGGLMAATVARSLPLRPLRPHRHLTGGGPLTGGSGRPIQRWAPESLLRRPGSEAPVNQSPSLMRWCQVRVSGRPRKVRIRSGSMPSLRAIPPARRRSHAMLSRSASTSRRPAGSSSASRGVRPVLRERLVQAPLLPPDQSASRRGLQQVSHEPVGALRRVRVDRGDVARDPDRSACPFATPPDDRLGEDIVPIGSQGPAEALTRGAG